MKEKIYRWNAGMYLEIEPEELIKYVPEIGIVLDLACQELAMQHGCPEESVHPDFESKGSCAKNCTGEGKNDWKCWKEYFQEKARKERK